MSNALVSLIILLAFNFSQAKTTLINKNKTQKRHMTEEYNYFADATKAFANLLSHRAFQEYTDYTIDNIRQGEIGESQAYFVRLVKPFSSSTEGICLVFLGTTVLQDKPHSCGKAE